MKKVAVIMGSDSDWPVVKGACTQLDALEMCIRDRIQQGLGIPGKINSTPASHLSTLCNQMVNFLGIMQNEWAGAQAFSSFDTYRCLLYTSALPSRTVRWCTNQRIPQALCT